MVQLCVNDDYIRLYDYTTTIRDGKWGSVRSTLIVWHCVTEANWIVCRLKTILRRSLGTVTRARRRQKGDTLQQHHHHHHHQQPRCVSASAHRTRSVFRRSPRAVQYTFATPPSHAHTHTHTHECRCCNSLSESYSDRWIDADREREREDEIRRRCSFRQRLHGPEQKFLVV